MKKSFLLFALATAAVLSPSFLRAETISGYTGNINGVLGFKSLDNEDWDPNDEQFLYGVMADFRKGSWPVSIAIDGIGSFGSEKRNGVKLTGTTQELAFGVRKVWENFGTIAPFVGVGPSIVRAHSEASSSSTGGTVTTEDTDTGLGLWVGGGLLVRVTPKFNLGASIRYTEAEVELFNRDIEAGGMQYMLLAGVHF